MHTGTRIGPYEIASSIGAGGMGEVFRARDTRLNRDVALKVLPKDFVADADRLRRFEGEAKTLAALNHPNVLTIHDAGVHEGAPYLVSELLVGKTLREEMNGRALPVRKATDYALQIAHGLAAALAKGVVHRDLKPENIFVTEDGRVKILDFGLAKLRTPMPIGGGGGGDDAATIGRDADANINITEPGMVLGTPAYMSPEQVRGEPTDHRADIFAFGCLLYEMLSGRCAFRRNTAVESMNAVLSDEPPDLTGNNTKIPPGLGRIVGRCLEKQPDSRFQSAADLAFALEAARAKGHPAGGGLQRETGLVSRGRVTFVIAVLVLLAVGIGWWWTRHPGPTTASRPTPRLITSLAVKPLDDFSGDTNNAYLSDGMTEALCASLGSVSALRVPGRSSVMRFKGGQKSIQEMAKELNVEAVVEGSIQRAGSRIMITVQLIDAATDRHLWATNYQRDLSDFFTVQNEVARAIANEVQVRLTPEDQAQLARARPANPDAVEACLLGMHYWWQFSAPGITNAMRYFRRAVEIDPTYARAYGGQALAFGVASARFGFRPKEWMSRSKAAAQKAIELDPNLVEGLMALGMAQALYDWDFVEGEKNIKRALELSRSSTVIVDAYAHFLVTRGRFEETLAMLDKAIQLDPVSPNLHAGVGWTYYQREQPDRGLPHLRKALELEPNFLLARVTLGLCNLSAGQPGAIAELQKGVQIAGGSAIARGLLGFAYGRMGQSAEAMKTLADIEELEKQQGYVNPITKALVHVGLEEKKLALDWLDKAYEERVGEMLLLTIDPVWVSLRAEPRFQALVKKVESGGRD